MGREIKRVPLDFDWPQKEVWPGYINPYWNLHQECECGGDGYSDHASYLRDMWYGNAPFVPEWNDSVPFSPDDPRILNIIRRKVSRDEDEWRQIHFGNWKVPTQMIVEAEAIRMCRIWNSQWGHHLNADDIKMLVDAGGLMEFTRVPLSPDQETYKNGWTKEWNGYTPTPEEVNFWGLSGIGLGSSSIYLLIKAICESNGISDDCPYCNGSGSKWPSVYAKKLCEDWEKVEPPTGDGWQVWETISEGSPVSPVFASEDELVNWLIHEHGYSEGAAEKFAKTGWAVSLAVANGRVYNDIETLNMAED